MSGRPGTGGGRQSAIDADYTPLGAVIKASGLSRNCIARESGVPRQWLWRYMLGLIPITALHMGRLCDYFDLTPDQLQTPEWIIEEVRSTDTRKTGVDVNRK